VGLIKIHHPDSPRANTYAEVTEEAFVEVWEPKGWRRNVPGGSGTYHGCHARRGSTRGPRPGSALRSSRGRRHR
jgi:hypothetical protein